MQPLITAVLSATITTVATTRLCVSSRLLQQRGGELFGVGSLGQLPAEQLGQDLQ
jgi:hypothetical protein